MTITHSATSLKAIIGRRSQQQDHAQLLRMRLPGGGDGLLVIVADGMGGAVGGQIASELAVAAFKQSMAASDVAIESRLRHALDAANAALARAVAEDRGLKGMGCTLIGAIVEGDRINWISVGDSLLLQAKEGRLQRLNADHSMAIVLDQAAARGEISADEAATSEQRHMLRSALTGDPIAMIDEGTATLGAGTRLIAATDGILTLSQAELAALMADAADADAAASAVIGAVEARMPDDQDNLTLAVVDIGGAGSASRAKAMPHPAPRGRWAAILLLLSGLAVSGASAIAWALGVDVVKLFAGSAPAPTPIPAPKPKPDPAPSPSATAAPRFSEEAPTFQTAKPKPPSSDGAKPAAAPPSPPPPPPPHPHPPAPPKPKPSAPPPAPGPAKSPATGSADPAKRSTAPGGEETQAKPPKPADAKPADPKPHVGVPSPGTR